MICWIYDIKDMDETPSVSLLQKIGIKDITSVLCYRRLRWYGHVQSTTSCIKSITNFPLSITKNKPRKPVFDIAYCCQPHEMGHGQHLNLKWIWMDDGWMHICISEWNECKWIGYWWLERYESIALTEESLLFHTHSSNMVNWKERLEKAFVIIVYVIMLIFFHSFMSPITRYDM